MGKNSLKKVYLASLAALMTASHSGVHITVAASALPLGGLAPLDKLQTSKAGKKESKRFDIYNTPFLLDLAMATINFPPSEQAYLPNDSFVSMPSIDLRMLLLKKAGPLRLPNGTIVQLSEEDGEGRLILIVDGSDKPSSASTDSKSEKIDDQAHLSASFDSAFTRPQTSERDSRIKLSAAGFLETPPAIRLLKRNRDDGQSKAFLLWTVTESSGSTGRTKSSAEPTLQSKYDGSFVALKHGTRIQSIQGRELAIGSGKLLARNSDDSLTFATSSGRIILGKGASAIVRTDGKDELTILPLLSPRSDSILLETTIKSGRKLKTILKPLKQAVVSGGQLTYTTIDTSKLLTSEELLDARNPELKPEAAQALADLRSTLKEKM